MPSHDRVWPHEYDGGAPVPPDSSQGDPEQPVARLQVGTRGRPFHRHQLLPQRQVLQHQFSMPAEPQRQRTTDDDQQPQHVSILAGVGATINPDEFWRGSGDYLRPRRRSNFNRRPQREGSVCCGSVEPLDAHRTSPMDDFEYREQEYREV